MKTLSTNNSVWESFQPSLKLAEDVLEKLPGSEKASLPEDIRVMESFKGNKHTANYSYAWTNDLYQWMRINEIVGDGETYIINIAGFPRPERLAPMIEAEVVVLRGKLFVIVLDILALGEEPTLANSCSPERFLSTLIASAESLPQIATADRPDWSVGTVSEHSLWSRPQTGSSVGEAKTSLESYIVYLSNHLSELSNVGPANEHLTSERADKLGEILRVFYEQGPANRFLSTYFGDAAASCYKQKYLYPVIH